MLEPRPAPDVLIVGPLAPPRGGVSTHVEQLLGLLPEHGIAVAALDHFSAADHPAALTGLRRNPLRYWWHLRRPRSRLVHYHFSRLTDFAAVALARSRRDSRPFVMTVHGNSLADELESPNPFRRAAARWSIRRFDAVIAVSPRLAAALRPFVADDHSVVVIPAYLGAPQGGGTLDPEASAVIRRCRPSLVVSAYQIDLLQRGGDLYGIDAAVDAFVALAPDHDDLGLVVFLAKPPRERRTRRYLAHQLSTVAEAGLRSRFALCVGQPLAPAFASDGVVFLRPTRRDGDAVSVREALAADVPVIASDVAPRPAGVIVVPGDDLPSLTRRISDLIGGHVRDPCAPDAGRAHLRGLLTVYARLLDSSFPVSGGV